MPENDPRSSWRYLEYLVNETAVFVSRGGCKKITTTCRQNLGIAVKHPKRVVALGDVGVVAGVVVLLGGLLGALLGLHGRESLVGGLARDDARLLLVGRRGARPHGGVVRGSRRLGLLGLDGLGLVDHLIVGSFAGLAVHFDRLLDLAADALERVQTGFLGRVHLGRLVGGGLLAVQVRADEEADEEEGQGQEVGHVEPDGEALAAGVHAGRHGAHAETLSGVFGVTHVLCDALGAGGAESELLQPRDRAGVGGSGGGGGGASGGRVQREGVVHEQVGGRPGGADEELGDLHAGQRPLNNAGDANAQSRHGVVGVHHGVDGRVDEGEDQDGRRDVANTRPHAHHRARVVVGLQGRALLALGQDDGGIDDLVELGQVEDPAQVGQTLVPQAADVGRVGDPSFSQLVGRVPHGPLVNRRVVGGGVAVAPGAIDLAHGVGDAHHAIGVVPGGERVAEGLEHADEGPSRVDGEEDIVEDDEELEELGLAEAPGLVTAGLVDAIEQDDGDGVDPGDGDGDTNIQGLVVEGGRDVEGLIPGGLIDNGSGKGVGQLIGRKFQQGGGREANAEDGRSRRGVDIEVVHG